MLHALLLGVRENCEFEVRRMYESGLESDVPIITINGQDISPLRDQEFANLKLPKFSSTLSLLAVAY
jgi:hypothetical protein